MSNNLGILGIMDGKPPTYLPDERWHQWSMDEIYLGNIGLNKYIPKVNDYIIEPQYGNLFIVTSLHPTTYVPDFKPISISTVSTDKIASNNNVDVYRIFYDKSITPHTLTVDNFFRIYSSVATYVRIYKGTYVDDNTNVISEYRDNAGALIGNDIPLDLLGFNNVSNYAIKTVRNCNTSEPLLTGDVCTIVVYNSDNKVQYRTTAIVEETTFIVPAYSELKYITNIYLDSPFIDKTNNTVVNFPINLDLTGFAPRLVRVYNDGSKLSDPIDGSKFRLDGLTGYNNNIVGSTADLVLSYTLDPTESALSTISNDGVYITRPYKIVTVDSDPVYGVKLFLYPVWDTVTSQYRYKVTMLNLDRTVNIDVTSFVTFTPGKGFVSTIDDTLKEVEMNINLNHVSSFFKNYVHTQKMYVKLSSVPVLGATPDTYWTVIQSPSTGDNVYGTNLKAVKSIDGATVNIGNDSNNLPEFLLKSYLNTHPLINPMEGITPPTPTHFTIKYLGYSKTYSITSYKSNINIAPGVLFVGNTELVIEYVSRLTGKDLILSTAVMVVR